MFDLIKDVIVDRKIRGLQNEFNQLGQSFASLVSQPENLKQIDPKTAWQMLHGLQAALEVAEKTMRMARQSNGLPEGATRRMANDLQSALAHIKEFLERDIMMIAEKEFGFPPKGTRWNVSPPESQTS